MTHPEAHTQYVHTHSHAHVVPDHSRAFAVGVALNVLYIIVEVVAGVVANSTALFADAGHNLSDVVGLLLAWGAAFAAKTPSTSRRTYGLRKATILAALLNAIILLVAAGGIVVEAVRKIAHPDHVGGGMMMIVAGIGVVINGATALLFVKGKERDINIKGAFLHMAADAGVSVGVVISGLLITLTGWDVIDPLIGLVIVVIITAGTWGLLRDSFHLSMDAVPSTILLDDVRSYLRGLPGVSEVHHLHVWAMSTTEIALTVHLVMPLDRYASDSAFLPGVCRELHDRFGIEHPTIQIEAGGQCEMC